MRRAHGIAERATREIIAELARQAKQDGTTLEQKLEIARSIERLNKQLSAHKKSQARENKRTIFD